MDLEEEVFTPTLLQEKNYKKKKKRLFNQFIAQCLQSLGIFSCLLLYEDDLESQRVGSCSISVINNSVSNEDLIASTFLEESELGAITQRLPAQSRA